MEDDLDLHRKARPPEPQGRVPQDYRSSLDHGSTKGEEPTVIRVLTLHTYYLLFVCSFRRRFWLPLGKKCGASRTYPKDTSGSLPLPMNTGPRLPMQIASQGPTQHPHLPRPQINWPHILRTCPRIPNSTRETKRKLRRGGEVPQLHPTANACANARQAARHGRGKD